MLLHIYLPLTDKCSTSFNYKLPQTFAAGEGVKHAGFVLWLQRPANQWKSKQSSFRKSFQYFKRSQFNSFPITSTRVFKNMKYREHPYSLAQVLGKTKEIRSSSVLSLTFSLSHPRPSLEEIWTPRSLYPMYLHFCCGLFCLHINLDPKEHYASYLVKLPSCHY